MSRIDSRWKSGSLSLAIILLLLIIGIYSVNQFREVQADSTPIELKQRYDQLLAMPSSVQGHWLRTLNPQVQDVQGGLVWNSQLQQGVMQFINLPQPKTGTYYQLWLYDARSQTDLPVIGAAFRQGSGQQVWFAPIQVATPVAEPYKFELHLQTDTGDNPSPLLLMVQP